MARSAGAEARPVTGTTIPGRGSAGDRSSTVGDAWAAMLVAEANPAKPNPASEAMAWRRSRVGDMGDLLHLARQGRRQQSGAVATENARQATFVSCPALAAPYACDEDERWWEL